MTNRDTLVPPCCRKLRTTVELLTRQLASQSNERKKYEDLQQKLQLIEGQTSESNGIIERLTSQLHELKRHQQKTQEDFEAAKRRISELTRQLQLSENSVNALKIKADTAEVYKSRYHHVVDVCYLIKQKRISMGERFKDILVLCKQYKKDYEAIVAQCEKLKNDNVAAANRYKLCKRHMPTLLKLVDELTPLVGNLPYQTRRRIDTFASQEMRTQLLGTKQDIQGTQDSDDEMANDIEALILGGVKANPSKRTASQPRKRENNGVKRGKRVEHHNVEENERLMEAMLQQKLGKGEAEQSQPISEIAGGHLTIHGKKGPTVRQQQAEMIPVKERIAQMKAEEKKINAPCKSSDEAKLEKEELSKTVQLENDQAGNLFGNIEDIDDFHSFSSMEEEASVSSTAPVDNPLKRKAETELVNPAQQTKDMLNSDQIENGSSCMKFKRIALDESRLQKIVDLAIEEMKHYVCQLDLFKKCYKLADQKDCIFDKITQRITRDPQPHMVAEFAVKSSVLIALLNSVSSCGGLSCDKKNILLNFLNTSLDRARQIDEFLSQHKEHAPEHRIILLNIVQKFSSVLTRNPIII